VALSLIRRAYWDGLDNSYETQLHNEAVMQRQAGRTSDFAEGVSAFLGKRPAQFKGQ
jgi:2-(1,2-epoxy-1,2-dihydrophenyl)acetyl-CoA isomerase